MDRSPKIAVIVQEFLPIGQVWIWRQLSLKSILPHVIFTRQRSNAHIFPHDRVVIYGKRARFRLILTNKLWFFFKYFHRGLNGSEKAFLSAHLTEHEINLVHAHFGTVGCEILDLCKEMNLSLIVTFHGFDATSVPNRWPAYRKKLHELFRHSVKIIAVSNFIRDRLISLGCPPHKVEVRYLGVPIPSAVKEHSKMNSTIRFIHLGSFVEKKGVPDLIRAFVKAFPVAKNVELLLVGDGPQKGECENLVRLLNPANAIIFKQAVPSHKVFDEFLAADVFVLNSRTDSQGTTEGLPIALLEAQSCGLPVISTIHAGIPEGVLAGVSGLLIPEKNEEELIAALKVLSNRDTIRVIGMKASEFIKQSFDQARCNEQLEDLYYRSV